MLASAAAGTVLETVCGSVFGEKVVLWQDSFPLCIFPVTVSGDLRPYRLGVEPHRPLFQLMMLSITLGERIASRIGSSSKSKGKFR